MLRWPLASTAFQGGNQIDPSSGLWLSCPLFQLWIAFFLQPHNFLGLGSKIALDLTSGPLDQEEHHTIAFQKWPHDCETAFRVCAQVWLQKLKNIPVWFRLINVAWKCVVALLSISNFWNPRFHCRGLSKLTDLLAYFLQVPLCLPATEGFCIDLPHCVWCPYHLPAHSSFLVLFQDWKGASIVCFLPFSTAKTPVMLLGFWDGW